ncbi:MerR family transcriptional regulator [Allokutzneria sp. A3M-2-11 16]|uniref:MerR family transcriptional regulator n=1 Tax=Allokutzneria sp. A3M-2-11 16 TaxID=2962043 RepID=UPI0020B652DD|nr:MerR family transcriptional regulator [Allokutzneria sp. A3M-2-11 16]MCP3802890.1 MerR family transcriptional regulator [Allokutzneria sp. A3M-2-11 16]
MRIGDAAVAAGTTPRALRFYEQRGLLPPPIRTGTGQRVYSPRDVARVRVIRELLALGLTVDDLSGCADRLDDIGATPCPKNPADGVAARRLETLNAEINRLTAVRDRLAERVELTQ